MQTGIEHLDDLATDLDRVRNIHHVPEQRRNAGGEGRLAVAGRPKQQHRPAGVDRGKKLAVIMLRNDQTLEPFAQSIGVQHFIGDALPQDLFLRREFDA